jgi:hypothetical protein
MDDDLLRVETWLLHRFSPQSIGGVAQPQVRIVPPAPAPATS